MFAWVTVQILQILQSRQQRLTIVIFAQELLVLASDWLHHFAGSSAIPQQGNKWKVISSLFGAPINTPVDKALARDHAGWPQASENKGLMNPARLVVTRFTRLESSDVIIPGEFIEVTGFGSCKH